jgi:hypothetical protein
VYRPSSVLLSRKAAMIAATSSTRTAFGMFSAGMSSPVEILM